MTDEQPQLDEEVRRWLETSGRALELRVAREFRRRDADVEPSVGYTDVATGKLREADVVATFTWAGLDSVPCTLTTGVECKSSKDKPWVAFMHHDRSAGGSELDQHVVFMHGPVVGLIEPLASLWIGRHPFTQESVATHVATAFGGSEKNAAYDAVRQALSLGLARGATYIQRRNLDNRAVVILAAVVTAAPLFTCHLAETSELQLARVEAFSVWAYSPDGDRRRVYVVSEDALSPFIDGLRDRAAEAGVHAHTRR